MTAISMSIEPNVLLLTENACLSFPIVFASCFFSGGSHASHHAADGGCINKGLGLRRRHRVNGVDCQSDTYLLLDLVIVDCILLGHC